MKKLIYTIVFVFFVFGKQTVLFCGEKESFSSKIKDFSLLLYGDSKLNFAVDFKNPLLQAKFAFCENKWNFGVCGSTSSVFSSFPVTVKTGNLSESGSLSKLKSPVMSGGNSPFSMSFTNASAIAANLPGYTSFSKPFATFVEAGFNDKKRLVRNVTINGFYSPEKENLAFSSLVKTSFLKNKVRASFSVTAGFFSYDEYSESSWFMDNFYYPKGNHFCALYNITAEIPYYKISLISGSYENPFGEIVNVYRCDNNFISKYVNACFSIYYNPNARDNSVLSASQTILQDSLQIRGNVVHKSRIKNGFMRNGLLLYTKMGLSDNYAIAKASIGTQIITSLFSVTFYAAPEIKIIRDAYDVNNVFCEMTGLNFNLSNRWYLQVLSPALCVNSSFSFFDNYNAVKSTTRIGVKLYFQKNPYLNGESSYSFSINKGDLSSQNINFSLSAKFTLKKVIFLCNLGWKVEM